MKPEKSNMKPFDSKKSLDIVTGPKACLFTAASNTQVDATSTLTKEQIKQLLSLISLDSNMETANMAGNHPYSALWIIDTGASDHMTSDLSLLCDVHTFPSSKPVRLPNGQTIHVTHYGTSHIFKNLILYNFLYVPNFQFNLLSVHKLTDSLNCVTIFFPMFCVF
jgi:hypothetical protein